MSRVAFASRRAFIADRPARRSQAEADFGYAWTAARPPVGWIAPTYRVSFVPSTREFYAAGNRNHEVILIGAIPDGFVAPVVHARSVMTGWEDHMADGLAWVRDRIVRAGGTVGAVDNPVDKSGG